MMRGRIARWLLGLILTVVLSLAHAQHTITAGEYRSLDGAVSLLVARPSGKNWTVRGTLFPGDGSVSLTGTLYASGKLALKGEGLRDVDGSYSAADGTIKLTYRGTSELYGFGPHSYVCYHAKNLETVWALEPGYPKIPAKADENINLVVTDSFSGTLTWKNYAKKDGNFIDQTFKFYVPKSTYRPGEVFEMFVDGSGTDHTALPVTMIVIRSAYVNRPAASPYYSVLGIDNGDSQYGRQVGWRPSGKVTVQPPNGTNDRLRFVIGIVGDVLEWWYRPEVRVKGAKESSSTAKPVVKPNTGSTGGGGASDDKGDDTAKPPSPASLTASQVTGDVSYRVTGGGSDYMPLTAGTVLTNKMEIDADPDSSATLRLPNGAIVTIKGGTRVRLEDLTPSGGQARVSVRLLMGEIIYRHNANSPSQSVRGDFVILTNTAVTSTRGTEFTAKFDAKTFMLTLDLREGKLEFNPGMNLKPIMLEAPTVFSFIAPPP